MKPQAKNLVVLFAYGLLAFSLSGCIATSTEMADLRDDITRLQARLTAMQSNQADVSTKMDTVSSQMEALTSTLDETGNRMSLIGQRLDDVSSGISQRMDKLFEQMSGSNIAVTPAPSQIYSMAYSDFSRGKYELAATGFRTYLEKYPQGELAAQSQYYLAECYYSNADYKAGLEQFRLVEKNYPKSDVVPASRLKQALSIEMLGNKAQSREIMQQLIEDFPKSPEAFTAKEKLNTPSGNGK
jgi:tol-pal system protein YbgF